MSIHPIHVREEGAAELVASGSLSTFRLWVGKGWMPKGAKLGKYRYWLVTDLIKATERLHHGDSAPDPEESRYAKAKRAARRAGRAR